MHSRPDQHAVSRCRSAVSRQSAGESRGQHQHARASRLPASHVTRYSPPCPLTSLPTTAVRSTCIAHLAHVAGRLSIDGDINEMVRGPPSTALRALSPWPCHYAPLSHPRRARCRLTVCMRHVASGVLQMWHQELDYKLQWSDNRLWTAHCAGALAPRLSALGTGVLADAAKPEPSHSTPSRVPSAPPPVLLM